MSRLRAWGELCRVEYLGFAVTAPLGALTVAGAELAPGPFAALLLINMMTVAWGFAHNDYCDLDLDCRSADKQTRALVRGDITPRAVLVLTLALIAASLLLALWLWGTTPALALLASALAATAAYNAWGKRFPGGDLFYALAGASLFALGASTAVPGHDPTALPLLAWLLILVQLLNHFYFNAINGGVKDADADRAAGVPTLAARAIVVEEGHMSVAPAFRRATLAGAGAIAALCLATFALADFPWYGWQPVAVGLLGARSLWLTHRLLALGRHDRAAIAQLLVEREMTTTGMILLIYPALIGWAWLLALIAVPMAGYALAHAWLHDGRAGLPDDY